MQASLLRRHHRRFIPPTRTALTPIPLRVFECILSWLAHTLRGGNGKGVRWTIESRAVQGRSRRSLVPFSVFVLSIADTLSVHHSKCVWSKRRSEKRFRSSKSPLTEVYNSHSNRRCTQVRGTTPSRTCPERVPQTYNYAYGRLTHTRPTIASSPRWRVFTGGYANNGV